MNNKPIYILLTIVLISGIYSVVRHLYMQPNYDPGEKAPDFMGATADGHVFKLSDLKGTIVLLDFWGSWCGPCIKESPELIKLYEEYGNRHFTDADGFTIVSVAIEKNRERWERAIERLGLTWPHQVIDPVSSFRFFDSPIANEYGVKEVPSKFLIDEKGYIVKVNPTFEEIRAFLEEKK